MRTIRIRQSTDIVCTQKPAPSLCGTATGRRAGSNSDRPLSASVNVNNTVVNSSKSDTPNILSTSEDEIGIEYK